jgi:O-antigen ligase
LTLYVALNLFVFSLGISNGIKGEALILSNFGVNIGRVSFLFSNGVNSYGSFLGILLSLSLIGCFVIKRNKKIFLIGLVSSMVSLLLTDSRGAIAYSFLILGAIKFYYFKVDKPKFLYFVPILTIVGPLLLLLFLSFLSTTEYGSIISRKDGDLATGNSRAIIWGIAVSEFLNFELNHHIFGYGEWGHYTSGASPKYALVFGDSYEANFMHPHNTSISILLDYGYFGLIIYTMIQYKIINIIKKYWSTNKAISCLLLANILYLNLVGIGETMFGFYYQNVTYVFFMINIFAFLLDYQCKKGLQRKKYV